MERNWKMLHSGSVTDKKGYRWLYTIQDDDTCEVIGCGLEEADAKIISQAPETLRQRDGLLDVLKQLVRLADRALRRDEIFRGKALNEIGNKAEQAIASVEGSG